MMSIMNHSTSLAQAGRQMPKLLGVLIAVSAGNGCFSDPDGRDTATATQELCNQNLDTCPNFPAYLRDDTDSAGRAYVHNNYPGLAYHPDGLHCTYGPAVSSCSVHVHLTSGLAVNVACAEQNSGAGFNCTYDIVPE